MLKYIRGPKLELTSRPLPPSPGGHPQHDGRRKAGENKVRATYSARLLVGRLPPPPPVVALGGGGAARRDPRRSANVPAIAQLARWLWLVNKNREPDNGYFFWASWASLESAGS
jgi:hypothetical protein